jgi:Pyruvate/2-oxoacid:ferredoxin oxidoreductase gamma subunit
MPATNDTVQKYYDALISTYDVLAEAASKSAERSLKITRQFASDIAAGQREALEIGKKLATEPTDFAQYYTALLEATTNAQGRALAFAQVAYQEALSASSDARETLEKIVESNRVAAESAVEVARSWATANPWADAFRQGIEAFTPRPAAESRPRASKAKEAATV